MRTADRRDFEAFAVAQGPALMRTALHLVGERALAEDLLQSTLLRLSLAWGRGGIDAPVAYARATMVNLARDAGRRRTRRPETVGLPRGVEAAPGPDPAAGVVQRDALVRALAQLPARQRAVVVLRHVEDLSEAEVAAALGIAVGTVKSTGSRGLARLRELLDLDEHAAAADNAAGTVVLP